MKIKRLFLLLMFAVFPTFAAYQQQWFATYQELDGNMNFACTGQCFVLIGPMAGSDTLTLNGTLQGNGIIGYGFVIGQQIAPGETLPVNWSITINQQFSFNTSPVFSQIPSDAQIVIMIQGAVMGNQVRANIWFLSFFEKFGKGFKQALEYKEYNPRTINFLEWPLWNGKYINQYFFWRIIVLLAIAWLFYRFSTDPKNKQKSLWFGVGVLVFFWIFFDLFSTVNQVKIYTQTMSATNIMENGRVGRTSDFYQFLDFIKTKVPTWAQWFFVAPYPFYFEGKYHIYPDVKFNIITWVEYIFTYNPYGAQNPFDFKDPVYSGGILFWDKLTFSVKEEIVWQPYAKIYKLSFK
jgi:hypothetical protein